MRGPRITSLTPKKPFARHGECVWLVVMLSWKYSVVGLALISALSAATSPVDYTRDVKPIFKQHCYRCHGASQQKGGMRADTVAFLREGGETGAAFMPGKSAESILVQAIL